MKLIIVVCCQLLPCFCTEGGFDAMVAKPGQVNALITEIIRTSFEIRMVKKSASTHETSLFTSSYS